MPSCISKSRFVRVRISILASKIISGHLEAAGGSSWRSARYRYRGKHLICLPCKYKHISCMKAYQCVTSIPVPCLQLPYRRLNIIFIIRIEIPTTKKSFEVICTRTWMASDSLQQTPGGQILFFI